MGIFTYFINYVLMIVLIMSILNIIVEIFSFVKNLQLPVPQKYIISQQRVFLLGLSMSYAIAAIFKGIVI